MKRFRKKELEVARAINAVLPYSTPWKEAGPQRRKICLTGAKAALETARQKTLQEAAGVVRKLRVYGSHDATVALQNAVSAILGLIRKAP